MAGTPGHRGHPAGPGQRDEPGAVRATFGRLFQGPNWVAERAYDRGRSTTPTTCGARSRRRCSPPTAASSGTCCPSTRTWAATRSKATPAARNRRGPGRRRPDPAERRGPRGVRAADPGLPRTVRHPADRLGAGRGEARPDPEVRLGAHAELADPGARRRRHRGGQDRQPPVRRPGRRRQPDPGRPGGQDGGRRRRCRPAHAAPSGDGEQTAGLRRFNAHDRQRGHGQRWRPAWTCRAGSTRSAAAGRTRPRPRCCTGPGHRGRRSPTRRSTRRWPGTPGSASRPARATTPSSPSRNRPPSATPTRPSPRRSGPATPSTRTGSTGCS